MTAEQKARDLLESIGVEDAQNFSAGELVELANLISERDHLAKQSYATPAKARLTDSLGAWVRCDDRLPMPNESSSGYFWGWSEKRPADPPELLESWERDGVPMGFCHEACGIVSGISHWMPAAPPEAPNAGSNGPSGVAAKVRVD